MRSVRGAMPCRAVRANMVWCVCVDHVERHVCEPTHHVEGDEGGDALQLRGVGHGTLVHAVGNGTLLHGGAGASCTCLAWIPGSFRRIRFIHSFPQL